MPSWLITGSSRGIGLSIVQDLLKDENNFVIATARNIDGEGLQALSKEYPKDRFALVKLDVNSSEDIAKAVATTETLLPNGLDYFLSNAGVNPQPLTSFDDLNLDLFLDEIKFSTVSVVEVTRAFLPIIRKSSLKKILFVSSVLGSLSVGGAWPGVANSYSISKAALNMLARKWGAALKFEGIAVSVVHPGYSAETEVGAGIKSWMDKYAPKSPQITTKEAAEGVIQVAKNVTLENSTSFYNVDGSIIGW